MRKSVIHLIDFRIIISDTLYNWRDLTSQEFVRIYPSIVITLVPLFAIDEINDKDYYLWLNTSQISHIEELTDEQIREFISRLDNMKDRRIQVPKLKIN